MKKICLGLIIVSILISCGPHRMKCGPKRRCVENYKNINLVPIHKSTLTS